MIPPGLRFALPFSEHVAASDAAEAPWLSESFIRHHDQRWSITPNYPSADPQLKVRACGIADAAKISPLRRGPEDDNAWKDHPLSKLTQCCAEH